MSKMMECLFSFQEKLNNNLKLDKLIKNWHPNIVIKSLDKHETYTLLVREQKISQISAGLIESSHIIQIEGSEQVLLKIFSGQINPAEAVLDGDLAVFGTDQDQIKLDAITLIIWGM